MCNMLDTIMIFFFYKVDFYGSPFLISPTPCCPHTPYSCPGFFIAFPFHMPFPPPPHPHHLTLPSLGHLFRFFSMNFNA